VHRRVAQRLPGPPAEQVHEHVLSRTRRYLEEVRFVAGY
jgi:hypothetical protein